MVKGLVQCVPYNGVRKFCLRFVRILFFLIISTTYSYGHSYLIEPTADWKSFGRAHCRRGGPKNNSSDDCPGPCIDESSWFFNSNAPISIWKRGEVRKAIWNRNNHKRGFVRLSLVPRSQRMSDDAHSKNVVKYSCFESQKKDCNSPLVATCGTDVYTYQTNFTVPCVPDGDYVFGWSWYGAYDINRYKQVSYHFGDYWSCAFVRIQGGITVKSECSRPLPTFSSGTPLNQCRALSNRLGLCLIEPCPNAYGKSVPKLYCPVNMVLIGSECVPYISDLQSWWNEEPYGTGPLARAFGGKRIIFSECKFLKSLGSAHVDLYFAALKINGHLKFVSHLCQGADVPLHLFKNGLTIICVVRKLTSGIRFFADNVLLRHQYFEPYSISGNEGPIFYPFRPLTSSNSTMNLLVQIFDERGYSFDSLSIYANFI